jgi:ArsR family transcriptional regulator
MNSCIDGEAAKGIARVFKALGHPVRLQIVSGLLTSECNVKHMTCTLGLAQASVSQQLAVLRAAGVVECERRGNKVCYRVAKPWVRKIVRSVLNVEMED